MKSKLFILILLLLVNFHLLFSQNSNKIKEVTNEVVNNSWNEFYNLLSLPNDGYDSEGIKKNIEWSIKTFEKLGFTIKKLNAESSISNIPVHPLLLAEKKTTNQKYNKTLLIYFHMDGQPVDPSKWNQESPYIPVLKKKNNNNEWEEIDWDLINKPDKNWRIFARSASDDKGPPMMLVNALKIIEKLNLKPKINLKLIIDFQEEMGSPTVENAVKKFKNELQSDYLLIIDGPSHVTNEPTLSFGARGISSITLKAYGPKVPQHSGHYGNYAPNPAIFLSKIISSMKDYSGRVIIPGFHDGINLDEETKKILNEVPDDEKTIMKNIGIANIDKVGSSYQESIQFPSLNVRGLQSGWVGKEARTIVPSTAIAEIDVRLVKESNPERLIKLIKNHIINEGAYIIENREPSEEERTTKSNIIQFKSRISYLAFRTEVNSEIGIWASNALKKAFNKNPIKIRTSGGSIPISPFVTILKVPAITFPSVNRDNNQHSPNENIRIGNYYDGTLGMVYLLIEKP